MHLQIEYNGKTYISDTTDDSMDAVAEAIEMAMENLTYLTVEDADGNKVIFGGEAMKRSVVTVFAQQ